MQRFELEDQIGNIKILAEQMVRKNFENEIDELERERNIDKYLYFYNNSSNKSSPRPEKKRTNDFQKISKKSQISKSSKSEFSESGKFQDESSKVNNSNANLNTNINTDLNNAINLNNTNNTNTNNIN